MTRLIAILILICALVVQATIIPADRRIVWQDSVGVSGGIPTVSAVYTNFTTAPTLAALQAALDNCPSNQVVQLGNWTNIYSSDLTLQTSGVILRGTTNSSGRATTQITFSSGRFQLRAATFTDTAMNTDTNISSDATKGDTTISLANGVPSWITVGQHAIIDELDDTNFISQLGEQGGQTYRDILGNGARGKAQMVKVIAKTTTNITIELPLNESFRVSQTAQLAECPMVNVSLKRAGVEDVKFAFTYSSSGTEGILMYGCDNCWLKNVEGYNIPGTYHVWAIFDYRCEIRHSRFGYSHFYGGGQGYGLALYHYTSHGLFEDNIFENLHVAMNANYGASGNVFGYNYVGIGQSDANQEAGISGHGVCSWQCLWEGNWCYPKVLFDFTHGSGAAHHTVFRNRIQGMNAAHNDDVPISFERYNRSNNVVGNVLGVAGTHTTYAWVAPASCSGGWAVYRLGYYINVNCDASVYDSSAIHAPLIHGNYDVATSTNGGIVWDSTISDHSIPNSYYLASSPNWFGNLSWPPYSPMNTSAAATDPTNIPAGYRYIYGVDPPAALPPPPSMTIITIWPAPQGVTLSWNASADTNVVGYYVYYGVASSRNYTNKVNAGNSTNITITNLVLGTTYFFAVAAYNFLGMESAHPETNYMVFLNSELRFAHSFINGNGFFQTQLFGMASSNIVIQASTNLPNWISLITNNSPGGIIDYTDTNSIGYSVVTPAFDLRRYRFYRALLAP